MLAKYHHGAKTIPETVQICDDYSGKLLRVKKCGYFNRVRKKVSHVTREGERFSLRVISVRASLEQQTTHSMKIARFSGLYENARISSRTMVVSELTYVIGAALVRVHAVQLVVVHASETPYTGNQHIFVTVR